MLDRIQRLIKEELILLDESLKKELHSSIPLLNLIIDYVLKSKGKQIRPTIVILSAKMCGQSNPSTIIAASMIELLHTATLIHDDVIDEADTRRGFKSIYSKWKSKIAILIGDYMLSRGLLIAINNDEIELLRMMSESVKDMSEGELLQLEKTKRLNIDEEKYYEIISKKTATLIKTSCKAGVSSTTKDPNLIQLAADLGYHIGMAFQIKDDLLDLGTDDIGKPRTNDIRENKMTLPLIYTLDHSSLYERVKIKGNLRFRSSNPKGIQFILDSIHRSGGIEYATQKMNEHANKAHAALAQFPENTYRKALEEIIEFTIKRKN
jgi:octaprenyl-diphosphate synthase